MRSWAAISSTERPRRRGPATQAERQGEQAWAALERGKQALDRADPQAAIPWLERSVRYAPDDPTPLLSLAAARLATGQLEQAAADFAAVASRVELREAWLGEAVARLRLGDAAGAARALAHCLAKYRWVGPDPVADAVAERAATAGWCALAPGGQLVLRAMGRAEAEVVTVAVDGQAWRLNRAIADRACRVEVTASGRHLLGSPIDAAAIHRLEGIARERDGGLEGWAWYPADPEREPVLQVGDGSCQIEVVASDLNMDLLRPLTRPRRFLVAASELAALREPIVVRAGGRALAGSPLRLRGPARHAAAIAQELAASWPFHGSGSRDLAGAGASFDAVQADLRGPPAAAAADPSRPVAVVIPAYRGARETLDCIAAVRRFALPGMTIIVVDDASPEAALARGLDALANGRAIRLLRHACNRGFPASANAGLREAATLAGAPDVVLLNSDTLPQAGWLEGLRAAVHSAGDVGTATPFTNDGSIAGYPDPGQPGPPPVGAMLVRLARLAARAGDNAPVDVPTAVGFCMYLRRECLEQVGVFREDVFAQGYGEENDFCLRASHLGWRHVVVPAVFVAHYAGRSFGPDKQALMDRNLEILERLHPGYRALVAAWHRADPLAPARRRLDTARWRDRLRARPGEAAAGLASGAALGSGAVLLVTHDSGGGIELCIQDRCEAIAATGALPVVLRPVLDRSGDGAALDRAYLPALCRVEPRFGGAAESWPNLRYRLPQELPAMTALLRSARPSRMEIHHLLGHDHSVLDLARRLAIPYEVRVHDYAAFCPRISLVSTGGRYCGEPDLAGCQACVSDLGSRLEEDIAVAALRRRSAVDLAGAERVVAPSADAARRMQRHFPAIRAVAEAHEPEPAGPMRPPALQANERRVCVVGAIGIEKGYDVLLGCARDAAARDLRLRFLVVGHTIDDDRLIATGKAMVTGPFAQHECAALIRAQSADLALIPSVWPETWCFALSEAWRAGLAVAAFDIGAQSERIRSTGWGWLLPLGLSPAGVNNALLTLHSLASDGDVMHTV